MNFLRPAGTAGGPLCVGRGLPDAPDLPPGGKVAFAEQMTDEGATYMAFPVNGFPPPGCAGSPL